MTEDDILTASNSPAELERLYRTDPEQFTAAFPAAWARQPNSVVLLVWRERLSPSAMAAAHSPPTDRHSLPLTVVLSLATGTLVKLPAFSAITSGWYYSRFAAPLTVVALIVYFLVRYPAPVKLTRIIALACVVCFVYLAILPDHPKSDTLILSLMHMPLVLWAFLGIAFCGSEWRLVRRRIDYIRYWGEIMVYSAVVLLGGMVLTALTFALFVLIGLDITTWYMSYVVVYGIVASPIVASYLYDAIQKRKTKIAPMLANVFAPLLLVTVVVYLLAMAINRTSPFSDCDFLISLNGLLLLVLAITIFSVAERPSFSRRNLLDTTNISLVVVTLVIDAIALSAIVFRLSSMGLTPNRLAVLGTNVLVFVHLARLLKCYMGVVRTRSDGGPMDALTASYIPVYSIWTAMVAFTFPLLFRFD